MTSVIFNGKKDDIGKIVRVKINKSNRSTLFGERDFSPNQKVAQKLSSLTKKNSDTSLKFVYSDNNSLSVIFHDNELLIGVVGEFNKNLKELEKITKTSLYSRGNSILIKSNPEKNEIVKNAIKFLANQFINNGSIENKDIVLSLIHI